MSLPQVEALKLVGALIAGAAVLGFGLWVNSLHQRAQQGEQRGAVITATSGGVTDAGVADDKGAQATAGVVAGRNTYRTTIEEGRRNEPHARANADTPNPASVLDAARKRRLARERFGRVPGGDEAHAEEAHAAER